MTESQQKMYESWLDSLEQSEIDTLLQHLPQIETQAKQLSRQRMLWTYQPYPKQREFHAAGKLYRERLLMAANQVGKTLCAGMELAMHMTGLYSDWWDGIRFEGPIRCIAGSESAELTRKGVQRILLGPPEDKSQWGTGAIPKEYLIGTTVRQGVPDAVGAITTRHVSGGSSTVQMASYDQGRTKWQADTLNLVWCDEEPPEPVYIEALARTAATGGIIMVTFTPLLGMSLVVSRFVLKKVEGTCVTQMALEDAPHMTPQRIAELLKAYPEHARDARARGIPQLGSGRVFPVDEDELRVKPFQIPDYWRRIGGLDFGYEHPSAAVQLALDPDNDVIYVISAHRAQHQTPMTFAPVIVPWGPIPWAWPSDGLQHDKGSGQQLANLYKQSGLKMLPMHAAHTDGSVGLEAGVTEMLDRMRTGRWKVFENLTEWFEEFRIYHRKEGLIVKLNDDLISASRYAMMMRRFAEPISQRAMISRTGRAQAVRPDGLGWMAT